MGLQKDELDRMTLPKNSFYKIVGSFDRRQLVRALSVGRDWLETKVKGCAGKKVDGAHASFHAKEVPTSASSFHPISRAMCESSHQCFGFLLAKMIDAQSLG